MTNIYYDDEVPYEAPKFEQDKLERIFTLQKALDLRISNGATSLPLCNNESGDRISQLCVAIIHESVELQRLTNWKWWKKPVWFNKDEARKELVDIIHFVVSAAIVLGMTPSDILNEYEKKNRINHQRQEQGY